MQSECAVVCIDFSDHAKRAFDEALRLWNGPLVLLHVIVEEEHNLKNYVLAGGDTQIVDMANQESDEDGRALLRDFKAQAEAKGRHVTCVVKHSTSPGAVIVDEIARISPRLVVLGSRGLSGLKKMLLGSVSQHIIENTHANVLVVK